jgi:hypothetical protein
VNGNLCTSSDDLPTNYNHMGIIAPQPIAKVVIWQDSSTTWVGMDAIFRNLAIEEPAPGRVGSSSSRDSIGCIQKIAATRPYKAGFVHLLAAELGGGFVDHGGQNVAAIKAGDGAYDAAMVDHAVPERRSRALC